MRKGRKYTKMRPGIGPFLKKKIAKCYTSFKLVLSKMYRRTLFDVGSMYAQLTCYCVMSAISLNKLPVV